MLLTLRARGILGNNEGEDMCIPELRVKMMDSLGEVNDGNEAAEIQNSTDNGNDGEEGGRRSRGNDSLLTVNGALSSLFNAEIGLITASSGFVIGAFVIAQQELVYGHA